MFRFANYEYLYFLFVIPVFVGIYLLYRYLKNKEAQKLGDRKILGTLLPSLSNRKTWLRFILSMLALAMLILAIARPQMGNKIEKVKREGIDLIIALDVSFSMNANDIPPSRISRAKQSIAWIFDKLKDDSFGLIVFAGDAYTQIPITTDYPSAKMFLANINTNIVAVPGTNIGKAISKAVASFPADDKRQKVIVLITDGENHEQQAVDAAAEAADQGIIVHTIGLGLPDGVPIPFGNGQYLRDRQGNVVVSKLNEPLLEEIAKAGKGVYVRGNANDIGLNSVMAQIDKMEKKKGETRSFSSYNELYYYFMLVAFLFLIAEIFITDKKTDWLRNLLKTMTLQNIRPSKKNVEK
jgi:Ca-activated chloride channel family protein